MKATAAIGVAAILGIAACSGKGEETAAPASASASGSAASAEGSSAPASDSPLSIVLESSGALIMSEVAGGLAIADAAGKRLATARGAEDLEELAMPTGLPAELAGVTRVSGRLPDSLWLSVALPTDPEKKKYKTPFFRLSGGKLKEIADDWRPLVVPWSKRRTLAISTSSGKLKIKVIEPFTKAAPADQPSSFVPDERCKKTLKLEEATSLPSGEVLAAGKCALGDDERPAYVMVRWPPFTPPRDAPAPATSAAAPSAAASAGGPEGPPADDEPDKSGAPMTLVTLSRDRLRHVSLVARSDGNVYVGATVEGAGGSRLLRVEGDKVSTVELPPLDEPLFDLALTEAGELWAITFRAAHRRAPGEAWTRVPLPPDVLLARVESSGPAVYFLGGKSLQPGSPGLVLKLGGGKALSWK
jgi:hypothetical protein